MIFRITVNDNDFTEDLEKFADTLYDKVFWAKKRSEGMSPSEWYDKCYKPHERVRDLLNPNVTESITDEDELLLKEAVTAVWNEFVDETFGEQETVDYLKEKFCISVSFVFTDKWENGEVLYYFTTNQKWITQ